MLSSIRTFLGGKPTPEHFLRIALKAFQRTALKSKLAVDKKQFCFRLPSGGTINLHNIYLDYCKSSRAVRKTALDRFVRGLSRMGEIDASTYEDVKDRLLPVLRHLPDVELMRIGKEEPGKRLSDMIEWAPFTSLLGVCVAVDHEDSIEQVGEPALTRWGLSFEDALSVAVNNLRHKAPPSFIQVGRGLWMANYGDFYDSPRVMLRELFWQLPLSGAPVVMVPNRSSLFVCGDNDSTALCSMAAAARKVLEEQARPLSAEMLRLEDDGWKEWIPEGEAGRMVRRLLSEQRTLDYRQQTEALDAANQRSATDVYVAPHSLLERTDDKELVSYAVLPKDIPTWLPKVDVLVLKEAPEDPGLKVSWEDFQMYAAELLEPLDFALPRFRVLGYPSADCLAALRATVAAGGDPINALRSSSCRPS